MKAFYTARIYMPPTNPKSEEWRERHGGNFSFGVVASSFEQALVAVRVAYPECRIEGINHQGNVAVEGA